MIYTNFELGPGAVLEFKNGAKRKVLSVVNMTDNTIYPNQGFEGIIQTLEEDKMAAVYIQPPHEEDKDPRDLFVFVKYGNRAHTCRFPSEKPLFYNFSFGGGHNIEATIAVLGPHTIIEHESYAGRSESDFFETVPGIGFREVDKAIARYRLAVSSEDKKLRTI